MLRVLEVPAAADHRFSSSERKYEYVYEREPEKHHGPNFSMEHRLDEIRVQLPHFYFKHVREDIRKRNEVGEEEDGRLKKHDVRDERMGYELQRERVIHASHDCFLELLCRLCHIHSITNTYASLVTLTL